MKERTQECLSDCRLLSFGVECLLKVGEEGMAERAKNLQEGPKEGLHL